MKKETYTAILVVLATVMGIAGHNVLWGVRSYQVVDAYYETAQQYVVSETASPSPEIVPEAPVESVYEESSSVVEDSVLEEPLELVEKPPITIDFQSLILDAPDAVGWLYAVDGSVNLPVVQGEDNQYYLKRLPDGSYSSGGSLFMDYLNEGDFTSEVTFIYGHNMKNGTMLQPILNYEKQEYYDKNPVMYILTPEKNYKLELFAGILTGIESDVYTFAFDTQEIKQAFIDSLVERSTFAPQRIPSVEEKLVCLSTCAYDYADARYVVFGTLIEIG